MSAFVGYIEPTGMSDSPGIEHFVIGLVTGQEILYMSSLSSWVYNGAVLQPWGCIQYLSLLLYRLLCLAYVALVALLFPCLTNCYKCR